MRTRSERRSFTLSRWHGPRSARRLQGIVRVLTSWGFLLSTAGLNAWLFFRDNNENFAIGLASYLVRRAPQATRQGFVLLNVLTPTLTRLAWSGFDKLEPTEELRKKKLKAKCTCVRASRPQGRTRLSRLSTLCFLSG